MVWSVLPRPICKHAGGEADTYNDFRTSRDVRSWYCYAVVEYIRAMARVEAACAATPAKLTILIHACVTCYGQEFSKIHLTASATMQSASHSGAGAPYAITVHTSSAKMAFTPDSYMDIIHAKPSS